MEDLNQRIGVSLTIYHFETNFVLPPREDGTQLTVEEWKRDLLKKMSKRTFTHFRKMSIVAIGGEANDEKR